MEPQQIRDLLAPRQIVETNLVTLAETPEGPLHGIEVRGPQAFATWLALRDAVPDTGRWPVIIAGDRAELGRIERGRDAPPARAIVASGLQLDLDAWMRRQREEDPQRFTAPRGEWPAPATRDYDFYALRDVAQRPIRTFVVALVPTRAPHEIPAHLRFGGWNDCPEPEVHVAALRAWHDRHQAEPVIVGGDTIELLVRSPPTTRQQALELAQAQYVYCPDIVDQGEGTVEALAASLLDNTRWFFWWD
jgi:hypothetical protein